jgi:hypothetical protein
LSINGNVFSCIKNFIIFEFDFKVNINYKIVCFVLFFGHIFNSSAQVLPNANITFDFNSHTYNETNNKVKSEPHGVVLVDDRFGNSMSALYLQGHTNSYFNLGNSSLLKYKTATISFWVKLERKVYAGKGYESNPLLMTRNSNNDDFYDGYSLFFDFKSDKLMIFCSKDSLEQSGVNSLEPFIFNQWTHVAFSYDNKKILFYINGKFQGEASKNFETIFLENAPVYIGNSGSKKNDRRSRGSIDDIKFYDQVLNGSQIEALYNEPNPNKLKNLLILIFKSSIIILLFIIFFIFLKYRFKQKLKQQNEKAELEKHITELEVKVVKTQMNPHFVSNSLAAIQELILSGNSDKAAQYLAKFSLFLRQVLNFSDKTFIRLNEEIEIINLIVELEQLRFKENFVFELKIDENITRHEILIPSLITQPFIENAIWHGLLPLKELRKPTLLLNMFVKEKSVYIEIEDNGVGRKILSGNGGRISKGTELAMDKIDSTNKLFNNQYSINIIDLFNDEKKPCGTKVVIKLSNYFE